MEVYLSKKQRVGFIAVELGKQLMLWMDLGVFLFGQWIRSFCRHSQATWTLSVWRVERPSPFVCPVGPEARICTEERNFGIQTTIPWEMNNKILDRCTAVRCKGLNVNACEWSKNRKLKYSFRELYIQGAVWSITGWGIALSLAKFKSTWYLKQVRCKSFKVRGVGAKEFLRRKWDYFSFINSRM